MFLQKNRLNKINSPLKYKWLFHIFLSYFFTLFFIVSVQSISTDKNNIKWHRSVGNSLKQPLEFYSSEEALRIADVILLYQRSSGGWPKNYDRTKHLTEKDKYILISNKDTDDTSFDNGSTHSEVRYLAKVYKATGKMRYKQAFLKGIEFMLKAQYENGGWPQFYPNPVGYQKYITFNDNAMIGNMITLKKIVYDISLYSFVSQELRDRCAEAVAKGVQCILKTQIVVDGRKTGWCAQYDEKLLVPRMARSYELESISGYESVGIVQFLMDIERPSLEVIQAVQDAIIWFNVSKIEGIRLSKTMTAQGWDRIVVTDTSAPPIWSRFYDINANKPLFSSRDGVPKYSIDDISFERRNGYSWLGYYPASLLSEKYPVWQKKWDPDNNVLENNKSGNN